MLFSDLQESKMKKLSRRRLTVNNNEIKDQKDENKSLLLNIFDSEPGYYHQIVHPLLISNQDKELVRWLRNTDLIKTPQFCSKSMISRICNSPMSLVDTYGLDSLQWKCNKCSAKKSIRDGSIFDGLSCKFKDAIRIILAWCKGHHVDYVANMLGIKNSVIEELYIRSASVAEKCMKSKITELQIGGPGVIVLVDTYPEGCTNSNQIRMNRPILCISEVKSIPQKYWVEALESYELHDTEHINSLKKRILRTVQMIVRPGSIIITPDASTLCSHGDFFNLRSLYPIVVNINDLARHNNDYQNVFSNLAVIWKRVLDICEEAQFYCSSYIDLFLLSHMWRKMYGNEAFEMLLFQISTGR